MLNLTLRSSWLWCTRPSWSWWSCSHFSACWTHRPTKYIHKIQAFAVFVLKPEMEDDREDDERRSGRLLNALSRNLCLRSGIFKDASRNLFFSKKVSLTNQNVALRECIMKANPGDILRMAVYSSKSRLTFHFLNFGKNTPIGREIPLLLK